MTTSTRNRAWPDIAIPPGELLGEELEARGMSQQELADRMGRPPQMINEVIRGKKAITQETAVELELVLSIPASFWAASENSYRLALAQLAERERLEHDAAIWLDEFPVAELERRGLIERFSEPWRKAVELLKFLGFSSFEQWEAQTAIAAGLRITNNSRASRGALSVWLREGELRGGRQDAEPYDRDAFQAALVELRAWTAESAEEFAAEMERRCAGAGVVVTLVREYPKANATGAARWLRSNKGQIQLSLRHKTADVFWFSFYHEAEHLLGRRFKGTRVDGFMGIEGDPDEEAACDRFARDALIPPSDWVSFTTRGDFTESSVRSFARSIEIHPGIVAGRLQHEKRVPYDRLNGSKMRLAWAAS